MAGKLEQYGNMSAAEAVSLNERMNDVFGHSNPAVSALLDKALQQENENNSLDLRQQRNTKMNEVNQAQTTPQIPMNPSNPLVSETPSADSLPPNIFLLPNESVPANALLEKPQAPMTIPVGGVPSISVGPDSVSRTPATAKTVDQSQYKTSQTQSVPQTSADLAVPQISQAVVGSYDDQIRKNNALSKAIADSELAKDEALEVQEVSAAISAKKQIDLQQKFESVFNTRMGELDNLTKQLANQDFSTGKIDANRFWGSRTTGQRILGAIALGLGGMASSFNGGPNYALEIINKAIDRDIEEQKFNIQQDVEGKKLKYGNLKDQVNAGQSMLQNLRTKYGDDMQAETALRLMYNQVSQAKIARLTNHIDNKVQQANVAGIIGGLQREQAVLQQQMKAQVLQQQVLKRWVESGNDASTLPPQAIAMLPKEQQEMIKDQRERSAPGWVGQAKDKESASKFVEKATEIQPAIDGAARILALTDPKNPKGASRLSPEDRARVSTELTALVGQLRVPFVGPGAMTEKEYERILNTLGDPNGILTMPAWQRVKLQTVFNKLNNDLDSLGTGYGFRKKPNVDPSKKRPY